MVRRGENIYKRKDGRWEGRYIKGRKQNGKIIYGYIYHKKYLIVKQKLLHYKLLHSQEQQIIYNGETIESWLTYWVNEEVKKRVKKSTFASYQHKIQQYIFPYIGKESLQKISDKTIQNWIKKLEQKGLSARTIHLIFQIFKMGVKSAKKEKFLSIDPTLDIVLPKVKKIKVRALTVNEQKKLEEEASKGIEGASIFIALYTGMRIGEISALKWTDIDFSLDLIYVKKTLQRIPLNHEGNQTIIINEDVKSSDSQRVIPLSKQLKNYLLWLEQQSNSVFVVSTNIKPLEPRVITYHFRKIINRIRLQHLHFHQLRHTFATRALELGADIVSISTLLGHHSPKFTLEVYTDSMLQQRKKIVQELGNHFLKKE